MHCSFMLLSAVLCNFHVQLTDWSGGSTCWPVAFALGVCAVLTAACRSVDPALVLTQAGGDRTSKKRLFLSAKGWQPGGTVAEDAGLLDVSSLNGEAPLPPDELPAFMLRSGLLRLQAFTARRAQAMLSCVFCCSSHALPQGSVPSQRTDCNATPHQQSCSPHSAF